MIKSSTKIIIITTLSTLLITWVVCLNIGLLGQLTQNIQAYNQRRIVMLCIIAIPMMHLLFSHSCRTGFLQILSQLPRLIRISLFIFFTLGLISAAFAYEPKMAYLQVGVYFSLLITIITIAHYRTLLKKSFDQGIIWTVSMMMLVFTGSSLIGYFKTLGIIRLLNTLSIPQVQTIINQVQQQGWLNFAYPTFTNPRFFAQFLSWILPFLTAGLLLPLRYSRIIKPILLLITAYGWLLVRLNDSRALYLGIILATGYLCYVNYHARSTLKRYFKWQLLSILIAIALYFLMTHILNYSTHRDLFSQTDSIEKITASARLALWHICIGLAKQHPILGVGPMQISYYSLFLGHPHNIILQIAAEWGIPAALLFTSLCLYGFACFSRQLKVQAKVQHNEETSIHGYLIAAALIMAGFNSLVSGTLVMPLSQITGAIITGWAVGWHFSHKTTPATDTSLLQHTRLTGSLLNITLLSSIACITYGVYPVIIHPSKQVNLYINKLCKPLHLSSCQLNPAFWVQGLLWVRKGVELTITNHQIQLKHSPQ